jgi:hypothetical protein
MNTNLRKYLLFVLIIISFSVSILSNHCTSLFIETILFLSFITAVEYDNKIWKDSSQILLFLASFFFVFFMDDIAERIIYGEEIGYLYFGQDAGTNEFVI